MLKVAIFSDFYEPLQRQINDRIKNDYHCFMDKEGKGEFDIAVCFGDRYRFNSIKYKKKIFITGEPKGIVPSYGDLSCFDGIISFRDDIHGKVISKFVPFPFHIGRNRKTFSFVLPQEIKQENKKNKIVLLRSGKNMFDGHIKREEIINNIIKSFGDGIDVINSPFDDKAIIVEYKYHICIENTFIDDYISEKLTDCLIAGCYPLYIGAPNVKEYFPFIDFSHNVMKNIERIILGVDVYKTYKEDISSAREEVLYKYNIFNYLDEVLKNVL